MISSSSDGIAPCHLPCLCTVHMFGMMFGHVYLIATLYAAMVTLSAAPALGAGPVFGDVLFFR